MEQDLLFKVQCFLDRTEDDDRVIAVGLQLRLKAPEFVVLAMRDAEPPDLPKVFMDIPVKVLYKAEWMLRRLKRYGNTNINGRVEHGSCQPVEDQAGVQRETGAVEGNQTQNVQ